MRTLSKIQITLLALILMVAIPFSVYAVDGKIKIGQIATTTFPIEIAQSGSYVLTSNLTVTTPGVNCITIQADNVTLDLNGFALIGPGTGTGGGNGISAYDKRNVTIKNGTIRNFLMAGIYLWTDTPTTITHHNHQVTDVKVYNNGGGIIAFGATIANCVSAENAGEGMTVTNCIVKDCTVNNNGGGFESTGSTIINCTANNNTSGNGIYATNSTITNCTSNDNAMNGIEAVDCTIINCTANGANVDGINAQNSTITNCVGNENGDNGICVNNSTVTNFTAYSNAGTGVDAFYSTITNCTVHENRNGIYAVGSTITNCYLKDNTEKGIECRSHNRIVGNSFVLNGTYGILVEAGNAWNYIVKNSATGNPTANFQDNQGSSYMPICGVDATDNCNYGF